MCRSIMESVGCVGSKGLRMGNVVDYVRREFHGFAELPFGDVDSLVLAELSYMRLYGLVPTFGEAKSVATVPIRELLARRKL